MASIVTKNTAKQIWSKAVSFIINGLLTFLIGATHQDQTLAGYCSPRVRIFPRYLYDNFVQYFIT